MVVVILKKYHIRTHISLVPIASEEQPSTKVMKKKIHIGYILKSADIRTLVFKRYSENSSHPHIPAPTHAYPLIPTHTQHIPANALNLINHMKLYVNRPNSKKTWKIERTKEGTRVR